MPYRGINYSTKQAIWVILGEGGTGTTVYGYFPFTKVKTGSVSRVGVRRNRDKEEELIIW